MSALDALFDALGPLAIAVSGGVDSMTLAHAAFRRLGPRVRVIHAVSAAVPAAASARVRRHADRHGWDLELIDAGEFDDPRYLANPVNRCLYCKSALYGAMRARWRAVIASGANCDDLDDYRPGLEAAAAHGVRHPFVEAGYSKRMIRDLARGLGLDDLAELPASPCLASRIETGIPIDVATLGRVQAAEGMVADWFARLGLRPGSLRCRVRRDGVVVELDAQSLARADASLLAAIAAGPFPEGARLAPYRQGSAFLRPPQ